MLSRGRGARWPRALAVLAGLLPVLAAGVPALAQMAVAETVAAQDGVVRDGPATSGVEINTAVLNELSRRARAGLAPEAGQAAAMPALRPPPKEAPRSRLVVHPVRLVRGPPPATPRRKPLAGLVPRQPPGLPAVPPAYAPVRAAGDPGRVVEAPPATPAPPAPAEAAALPAGRELAAAPPPPEPARPPEPGRALAPPVPPPPLVEPPPPPSFAEAPPRSAPPPGQTQSAALPPLELAPGRVRLIFAAGAAELSEDAKRTLSDLAARLAPEGGRRLQLLAYADGGDQGTSGARRLSLSRALAVRAFLVEKGIPARRIDVRALGTKFEGGPADRVDVVDARR